MALSSKPPRSSSSSRHQNSSHGLNGSNSTSLSSNPGGQKRLNLFVNGTELQENLTDRFLFLIVNSIGAKFKGLTNSNVAIEGVLQNIDFDDKSLKIYVELDNGINVINYDDLIDFELENVDLYEPIKEQTIFKTDTDISRAKSSSNNGEREIEKWDGPASDLNLTLEDNGERFDQFKVNKEKFGIESSFDENLYTTAIDTTTPQFNERKARADELAFEIEGSKPVHKFDDSGLDEEDKYSGVRRETSAPKSQSPAQPSSVSQKGEDMFLGLLKKKTDTQGFNFSTTQEKPTKYIPPSQKKHLENIDPAVLSSQKPAAGTTAIQSSKLARFNPPYQDPKVLTNNPTPQQQNKNTPKLEKKFNNLSEINSLREFSQNFKIPETFNREKRGDFTAANSEKSKLAGSKPSKPEVKDSVRIQPDPMTKKEKSPEVDKPQESNSVPSNAKEEASVETESKDVTVKSQPKEDSTQKKTTESEEKETKSEQPKDEKKPEPTSVASSAANDKKAPHHHKLNPKAAVFTPSSNKSSPIITPNNLAKRSPNIASPNFQSPNISGSFRTNPRLSKAAAANHFFGPNRVPNANKKTVYSNENFFQASLKAHEKLKTEGEKRPFQLERPFVTPPTWSSNEEGKENSYKSFFSSRQTSTLSSPQPQFQQYIPGIPLQSHGGMHIPISSQIPGGPQHSGQFPGQFPPQGGFIPPYAGIIQYQQYPGAPNGSGFIPGPGAGGYNPALYGHPPPHQGIPHPGPPPPQRMGVPPHMNGPIPPQGIPHQGGMMGGPGYPGAPDQHTGGGTQGGNRYNNRGGNNNGNGGFRRNH